MRPTIKLAETKIKAIIIYSLLIISTILFIYAQVKDVIILNIFFIPCIYMYYAIGKKIYIASVSKVTLTAKGIEVINKDNLTDMKLLDQEEANINYQDISYVYFAEAELKNILYIKNKLKRYKIIENEKDFTPTNLIAKHNIPRKEIAKLMQTKGIIFDDNNVLDFISIIEEIKEKYDISPYKIRDVENDIKNKVSITYESIMKIIGDEDLKKKDILKIKKFFNENEYGIIIPYVKTKIDIDLYERYSKSIFETKDKLDWTLVLVNSDGDKKIYIPHFFGYSLKDRKAILEKIRWKTNAQILFTKEVFKQHSLLSED